MGNCCCSDDGPTVVVHEGPQYPPSRPPQYPPTALPTLQDCIKLLNETRDTWNIDELIQAITQLLMSKSRPPSTSNPVGITNLAPVIDSGATFLKFVNEHTQKMNPTDNFFPSGQGQKVVEEILLQLGKLHWIIGGLSIIAYLLNKAEKLSENRSESLQLLKYMIDLALHIKELKGQIPEEEQKLREALVLIVEGCMTCASQLHSGEFFSFLKASVDSQTLINLSSKVSRLYQDLTLATAICIKKDQPVYLPALHPKYPQGAVGLDKPLAELKRKLDLQTIKVSSSVVVIYGLGGIGKTTLANALVATLAEDLKFYNYTKVEISKDPVMNDFKSMQQQILRDCFPTYQSGREILVRNCEEGRNHITEAINCETKKPVFIFIDNALRLKYLEELLPNDLQGLPRRSRILVTARNMGATDFFKHCGIPRHPHAVDPLSEDHALQILCHHSTHDKISNEMKKIARIAGGIPLVLKIISARLRKQKYKVENCSQILQALEEGGHVTEENLSERLIYFVFNDLEPSTQEALLDICAFFDRRVLSRGWPRRWLEYIVGVEEVASLIEAAMLTSLPFVNSVIAIPKERVSWVGEEKLVAHDIIRANVLRMAEPTRIRDLESWSRAAQNQLQGIKGVMLEGSCIIEESQLSYISNSVRTLNLGLMTMGAPSRHRFKELNYLVALGTGWFPMNLEGLPSLSFYEGPISKKALSKLPQNLKYLKARNRESLEEAKSIQALRNSSLEELDLSFQEEMEVMLGGRFHFDALKILVLEGWFRMEELPHHVCGLPSLNKLILRECRSLKRVPESISNLIALTHLDLSLCSKLEEVCSSLGELTSLRYLDLSYCRALVNLPENFGQLSALEYLSLHRCKMLEKLPENFGQLRSLKGLDLSFCEALKELPTSFVQLPSLEVLWMAEVHSLLKRLGQIDIWKIID